MLVDVKNERVDSSLGTRSEQRPTPSSVSLLFPSLPLFSFSFFLCFIYLVSISFRHTNDRDSSGRSYIEVENSLVRFEETRAETRDRIVGSSGDEKWREEATTTTTTIEKLFQLDKFNGSMGHIFTGNRPPVQPCSPFDLSLPARAFVPLVHSRANRCY